MTGKEMMKREELLLKQLINNHNLLVMALRACEYGVLLYGSFEDRTFVTKVLREIKPIDTKNQG
jgi:hypothetical protein